MAKKIFILNADNLGQSKVANMAILYGYHNGFLTSASLCANGEAFDAAVNEIIPECPKLGVGVHLNITDGQSLTKNKKLTNSKGKFNNNFCQIMLNSKNKDFINEVEFEFRTQIETVMNYTKVDHIDSQRNIHAIPELFKITAKLAKEYNIKYVRNVYEELYIVQKLNKYINFKFPGNLFKLLFLNLFKSLNQATLNNFNLNSNQSMLGLLYKGLLDENVIEEGLDNIEDNNCIIEASINPCRYINSVHKSNDFLITQNKELKAKILRMGFEISAYKDINNESN